MKTNNIRHILSDNCTHAWPSSVDSLAVDPCKGQRGFTLIELMVVIAIMGVLAGLAAPSFANKISERKLVGCVREVSGNLKETRVSAITKRKNSSTVTIGCDAGVNVSVSPAGGSVAFNSEGIAGSTDTAGNFSKLTGAVDYTFTRSGTDTSYVLTINPFGKVKVRKG